MAGRPPLARCWRPSTKPRSPTSRFSCSPTSRSVARWGQEVSRQPLHHHRQVVLDDVRLPREQPVSRRSQPSTSPTCGPGESTDPLTQQCRRGAGGRHRHGGDGHRVRELTEELAWQRLVQEAIPEHTEAPTPGPGCRPVSRRSSPSPAVSSLSSPRNSPSLTAAGPARRSLVTFTNLRTMD
jgi:hypothetical protein